MRTSNDIYKTSAGELIELDQMTRIPDGAIIWQGFDYERQIWIYNGVEDKRTLEELQAEIKKAK